MASSPMSEFQEFSTRIIPTIDAFSLWTKQQLNEYNAALVQRQNAVTLRIMHRMTKFVNALDQYRRYLSLFPGDHLQRAAVALWFTICSAIAHGLPADRKEVKRALELFFRLTSNEKRAPDILDLYVRWNTDELLFTDSDIEKRFQVESRRLCKVAQATVRKLVSSPFKGKIADTLQQEATLVLQQMEQHDRYYRNLFQRNGLERFFVTSSVFQAREHSDCVAYTQEALMIRYLLGSREPRVVQPLLSTLCLSGEEELYQMLSYNG